jgi:DNA-binding GntR family transcriptional regulator
VAAPSVDEAKQVFAVRRMLEAEMTRAFVRQVTPGQDQGAARARGAGKLAVEQPGRAGPHRAAGRLSCAHGRLMGNQVLAELLRELISRCALITLMYQSTTRPSIPTRSTPKS